MKRRQLIIYTSFRVFRTFVNCSTVIWSAVQLKSEDDGRHNIAVCSLNNMGEKNLLMDWNNGIITLLTTMFTTVVAI